MTVEEYSRLEALSDEKLEYIDGHVVAFASLTRRHSRIVKNLVAALGPAVLAHGCEYFAGDAKIVSPDGDRTIPDFVVTCDERDGALPDDEENIVRHPCVIAEVTSPSTEAVDRGPKLDIYASIPDVTHYVLIESRRKHVTVFERASDGALRHRPAVRRLVFPFLPNGISIDVLYAGVSVPDLR